MKIFLNNNEDYIKLDLFLLPKNNQLNLGTYTSFITIIKEPNKTNHFLYKLQLSINKRKGYKFSKEFQALFYNENFKDLRGIYYKVVLITKEEIDLYNEAVSKVNDEIQLNKDVQKNSNQEIKLIIKGSKIKYQKNNPSYYNYNVGQA